VVRVCIYDFFFYKPLRNDNDNNNNTRFIYSRRCLRVRKSDVLPPAVAAYKQRTRITYAIIIIIIIIITIIYNVKNITRARGYEGWALDAS